STGDRRSIGEGATIGLSATLDAQLPRAVLAARNGARSGLAMARLGARSKRRENCGDSLEASAIAPFSVKLMRAHMRNDGGKDMDIACLKCSTGFYSARAKADL